MKIIHTADIHLDSPLTHAANRQKRRFELLQALSNLSEYANNNNVSAIIIAGDLFDDQFTTNKTIIGEHTSYFLIPYHFFYPASITLQSEERFRTLTESMDFAQIQPQYMSQTKLPLP